MRQRCVSGQSAVGSGQVLLALILVAAAIAIAACVAVSRAQAPGAAAVRIQVTVIQLKPDMMTTWEDLQKNEMIPAQKKAGLPWRHTLANGVAGQGIQSQHAYIYTLEQDASIISNATTMPQFQVVQSATVLPGKGGEFLASLREDYLPALTKAGVKDYWVWTLNGGAPGGERVLVRPIEKYAELDYGMPGRTRATN